MTDSVSTRRSWRSRFWQQIPLIAVLVVLWMLLWGQFTWLSFATGIVLAVLVTRAFYLPPVELAGRFNLFWFAAFVGVFAVQLVVASVQVASLAFAPRGVRHNSVIAVHLATRSDLMMTLTAIVLSLIPGSLVLEADRGSSILYLHVLDTPNLEAAEKARADVLRIERRLVRALGSRDDLERSGL